VGNDPVPHLKFATAVEWQIDETEQQTYRPGDAQYRATAVIRFDSVFCTKNLLVSLYDLKSLELSSFLFRQDTSHYCTIRTHTVKL